MCFTGYFTCSHAGPYNLVNAIHGSSESVDGNQDGNPSLAGLG